jgi:hypothetical protein
LGLLAVLFLGLFFGLGYGGLAPQPQPVVSPPHITLTGALVGLGLGLSIGLPVGLGFGLLAMLFFGLAAFFQHFILRFWLWRTNCLPWNLVPFLDEATERLLLRKVGGGYIFVHRLLLEYFASLGTTPTPDSARAKKEQA